MGDTTIKPLGLTKVSLRVYYWFLYDIIQIHIYVVVQFYPWFKFSFLLFLGMEMYDNEFETKEKKI